MTPDLPQTLDYRVIFNAASNGMAFTLADSGQIIDVNEAWTRSIGIGREQALGKTAIELGIWAHVHERDACVAELERNQRLAEREVLLIAHNLQVPYLVTSRVIDAGTSRLALWEFRDISAQKKASKDLQSAADWHRTLLQNTADGICIFDDDKTVLEVNDRFAEMLGYTPAEMFGMHPWDWDINYSESQIDTLVPQSLGANYTLETRHRRKDGSIYDAEITIRHAQIGDKTVAISVAREITQRKLTESRLLASEEKYRGIFDDAVTAIYVFDNAKRFVDSNQAGLDLLGYSRDELLHLSIPDVDADPLVAQPAHAHLREGGRLINYEHKLRRKDGTLVSVLNNSRPLTDAQGQVIGMQSTLVDVTESERLEAELQQAREGLESERTLLKTLVRTIPNLVWLKDTQGIYLACNAEFERFFGHSEAEIVGKTDFDFVPTELAQSFRDNDRAAMATGQPSVNEEWITYASDGHRAFLATTKTPMYRPDGSVMGVLGVAHDITNMRQQEEALRESQETLNRAQAVANVGSWRLDIESNRLEWSDETYRIFGMAPGAPLTMDIFQSFIHPEDLERVDAAWNAALMGAAYDLEHRILVNGQVRWVRERAIVARDDGHAGWRGLGTVQDVTDQHLAAQQLAQSQTLLRSVLDAVPVRIFWKDRQCRYLGCNPLFARDAGKRGPDEVEGRLDEEMGWADQADLYRTDDQQVMNAGVPRLNFEEPQTTPDGQTIYLSTSKVPLRDENGNVFGVLGIYDDITQRRQTEIQLKESEERFRALFNTSRDAIYLHDGPTIIDCNPAALALLGETDRSEIIGTTPARRARHDAHPAATRSTERINAALAGDPQQFEWPACKNDGSEVLLDVQLTRVDIGGRAYVQAIARDITERRRAEASLREERLLRDTIQDAIPGVTYAMDAKGDLVFWSHSFEQLTGRSADELAHFNALDLFDGEGRTHVAERIRKTFATGHSHTEADLVAKDGRRTPYFFTGRCIEMNGKPILVGAGVDMTERKATERALRQLNEDLESRVLQKTADLQASYAKLRDTEFAMDSVGIGIHWVDCATGRFVHVNQFAANILGYSRDELLQLGVSDIDPNFPPQAFQAINERIRQAGFLKFETEQIRRDGSHVPVEMTVYHHPEPDGTARMISFMLDITERKQAELALQQAKVAAENATAAKSAFLANMSHEIRTPLNAILGISYLLHQDSLTAAQRSKLDKIEVSGRHLLSLINDILDLSKIEAGKLIINHDNFHLSAVLDNVASIIKDSALEKGLGLDIDPDGVPVWLWGDATRLRQALLNFAGNAVKFTSHGTIHLRALLLAEHDGKLKVRFEVEDTGIGIAPEQQTQLFQDFVQADGTTARKFGGTGLGLSLTRRLMELMSGQVGVASTLGHGSTFWFEVPLERGHGPIPIVRAVESHQAAEWWLRQHHRGARILLAEDNEFNAEIVVELLHAAGLDVAVAKDGREALALACAEAFDLVLMDMQMPNMTGLEATRQIRTLVGWQAVPIVALTANAFTEDRQACLEAGMNDVLTKPVEPQQLYKALQTWLAHAMAPSAATAPTHSDANVPVHQAAWEQLARLEGVDTEAGLRMFLGNQEKYLKLMGRFVVSMTDRLKIAHQHFEGGQQDEACMLVHSMKGSAANMGLTALSAAAARLEARLREAGWLATHADEANTALAALEALLTDIVCALREPDASGRG